MVAVIIKYVILILHSVGKLGRGHGGSLRAVGVLVMV